MAGLLDLAPLEEVVDVRGTPVTVTGLEARAIARLLAEFPDLRKLLDGVVPEFAEVLNMAADALPKIIASGTAFTEDEALRLTLGEQARIFAAILRLTAPDGLGPLVEEVSAALGLGKPAAAASGAVASTDSPKRSRR